MDKLAWAAASCMTSLLGASCSSSHMHTLTVWTDAAPCNMSVVRLFFPLPTLLLS